MPTMHGTPFKLKKPILITLTFISQRTTNLPYFLYTFNLPLYILSWRACRWKPQLKKNKKSLSFSTLRKTVKNSPFKTSRIIRRRIELAFFPFVSPLPRETRRGHGSIFPLAFFFLGVLFFSLYRENSFFFFFAKIWSKKNRRKIDNFLFGNGDRNRSDRFML